jgi:putative peptidoglycan lipid II flippase
MQDTKTPVTWAVIAVAINVPLMALLVGPMAVEGLALALSISSVIEVLGLLWALRRRIESVDEGAIVRALARAATAGLASALAMLGALTLVEATLGDVLADPLGRLGVLVGVAAAGVGVFVAVAAALGSSELQQLRGVLRRRGGAAA